MYSIALISHIVCGVSQWTLTKKYINTFKINAVGTFRTYQLCHNYAIQRFSTIYFSFNAKLRCDNIAGMKKKNLKTNLNSYFICSLNDGKTLVLSIFSMAECKKKDIVKIGAVCCRSSVIGYVCFLLL